MTVKEFSENELLFNKLYEKTKDCGRNQFVKLLMQAERENKELKSQKQEWVDLLDKFKTQQKEFIEWLEKEIKETDKTIEMLCDTNSCRIPYVQNKKWLLKEILKKYKETIGVKDE